MDELVKVKMGIELFAFDGRSFPVTDRALKLIEERKEALKKLQVDYEEARKNLDFKTKVEVGVINAKFEQALKGS